MCIQGHCGFIFDYGIACPAIPWCGKALTNSVTRVTIKLQISVKPRRILRRGLIYDHNGYHRGFRDRREHLAQEDTRPFAFQTKWLKQPESATNCVPECVRIRKVEGSIPFVSTICKASGYTACLAFVSMARSVSPPGPFDSSGSPSRYRA